MFEVDLDLNRNRVLVTLNITNTLKKILNHTQFTSLTHQPE